MTDRPIDADVTSLGDGLFLIDAHMEGMTNRLACYLYDGAEPLLIDAGPSTSFVHLLEVLDHLGIEALARVLVTHIHIDHAGAAGHFARRFPGIQIAVHQVGAPHLMRPARLWNSAARIYGEEPLREMWGEMLPVAAGQIVALSEGDMVPLGGGRHLEVLDTPGHAKHHVAVFDPQNGGLYVGDTAGLCYPHGHEVQPNTPPPDFDPHLMTGSLRRMAALQPSFVGFAHYGPQQPAEAVLDQAERRVWEWVALIETMSTLSGDEAARSLRRDTLRRYAEAGLEGAALEFADRAAGRWDMHIAGVRRWIERRADQGEAPAISSES